MNAARPSLVVFALLVQALAGFMPCGRVLCVHDDGQSMIEPAVALCCRVQESPDHPRTSPPDQGAPGLTSSSGGDHCHDFPLPDEQALRAAASNECQSPAHSFQSDPPPALPSLAVELPLAGSCEPAHRCGPLSDAPLQHLRTIVLRC